MRIPTRDVLATIIVGVSVLIYGAWALGAALPWFGDVTAIAIAVLVLGVAASMSAVVPGFTELIHGSRPYVVSASVLGVVAFVAGVWAVVQGDATALALLMLSTIVLWGMSTARHVSATRTEATQT